MAAPLARLFDFVAGTLIQSAQVDAEFQQLIDRVNLIDPVFTALNIPTEEVRASNSYATLTTPDQIAGVVLPTDGLIAVGYRALWKTSAADAGRAAIFIGSNQLKSRVTAGQNPETNAASSSGTNSYQGVGTCAAGLFGAPTVTGDGSDVATGQALGSFVESGTALIEHGGSVRTIGGEGALGGPCYVFAAAGTYTISVQWKATSGSVTAKERKLWVWTLKS